MNGGLNVFGAARVRGAFRFFKFTFLRGASRGEELVMRAAQLGYSGLAIIDECSLAGVVRAHVQAKKEKLPLAIGSYFKLVRADKTHAFGPSCWRRIVRDTPRTAQRRLLFCARPMSTRRPTTRTSSIRGYTGRHCRFSLALTCRTCESIKLPIQQKISRRK